MHHAHYQASSAGAQALAGQNLAGSTRGRPTGRPAGLATWPLACTALVDLSLLLDGSVASSNLQQDLDVNLLEHWMDGWKLESVHSLPSLGIVRAFFSFRLIDQYFYNVKNGSSNITSKSSSQNFSNGEVFPENWHFNSIFVLKTTKKTLSVYITEIL